MREEPVQFGQDEASIGIVTHPAVVAPRKPAFLFLNSGILHRVGPNRLHVTMARQLAALGFRSFRIDLSGVGDTPARAGERSIMERWAAEARAAMDYMRASSLADEFIVVGNCSGAAMSFFTAHRDTRVVGAVLINFPAEKTPLRYFLKLALTSPKIWRRIFRGTVKYRSVLKSLGRGAVPSGGKSADSVVRSADRFDTDAAIEAVAKRNGRLLFVYSYWDPGLDNFNTKLKAKLSARIPPERLGVEILPGLNHDFNLLHGQNRLCQIVRNWAEQL